VKCCLVRRIPDLRQHDINCPCSAWQPKTARFWRHGEPDSRSPRVWWPRRGLGMGLSSCADEGLSFFPAPLLGAGLVGMVAPTARASRAREEEGVGGRERANDKGVGGHRRRWSTRYDRVGPAADNQESSSSSGVPRERTAGAHFLPRQCRGGSPSAGQRGGGRERGAVCGGLQVASEGVGGGMAACDCGLRRAPSTQYSGGEGVFMAIEVGRDARDSLRACFRCDRSECDVDVARR